MTTILYLNRIVFLFQEFHFISQVATFQFFKLIFLSKGNEFIGNSGYLYDMSSPTANSLELGSSFEFKGSFLLVNDSIFKNNSGYLGGALSILGNYEGVSNVTIMQSIFSKNYAYLGGAIGFSYLLTYLNALITNSSFWNNSGTSITIFFFYKIFFFFFIFILLNLILIKWEGGSTWILCLERIV